MNKSTRRMLNESEQEMMRLIEGKEFRDLDEDALLDLHARVRRARNKYAKLYRRRASAKVGKHGTRAMASKANQRTAVKAEVFEDALAKVSRRLARVAKASADQLRDERLAAARAARSGGKSGTKAAKKSGTGKGKGKGKVSKTTGRARTAKRTPASKRASASSRAATRRHQAKRAGR